MTYVLDFENSRKLLAFHRQIEAGDLPEEVEIIDWLEQLRQGATARGIDEYEKQLDKSRDAAGRLPYPYSAVQQPQLSEDPEHVGRPPAVYLVIHQKPERLLPDPRNHISTEKEYQELYDVLAWFVLPNLSEVTARDSGWYLDWYAKWAAENEPERKPSGSWKWWVLAGTTVALGVVGWKLRARAHT